MSFDVTCVFTKNSQISSQTELNSQNLRGLTGKNDTFHTNI